MISSAAQVRFEAQARRMGLDPSDRWVGADYVEYQWNHLRPMLDSHEIDPDNARPLLEFGCNVGASAIVYAHLGAEVIAVDVRDDFINLARLNAERFGRTDIVFLHVRDTRSLPFPDGHFDLVNCSSVLEYVRPDDLPAVQREIDRVLKPGGKIVVTATSSRLSVKEVHSGKWLINYLPRTWDRLLGAGKGLKRGVSPWTIRYGFGPHYTNLDAVDGGRAYLNARVTGSPAAKIAVHAVVRLSRVLGIGPGMLANNISCVLQKCPLNVGPLNNAKGDLSWMETSV